MKSLHTKYCPFFTKIYIKGSAMYKTRNTGTGNGMRGTRGIGGMLYSGECRQIFRECHQILGGMSPNILGNIAKYSGECRQIFRGMWPNIPGNVVKHSGECPQIFRETSPNIPGNVTKHFREYHQRFHGMPTAGWLSNSTVGRLSIGRSFIKLFVVYSRFYNG